MFLSKFLLILISIHGLNQSVAKYMNTTEHICDGAEWSCKNKCGLNRITPCSCQPVCKKYQICCEDYDDVCAVSGAITSLPENNEVTTKSGLPENNEVTTDNGLPENNEVTTKSGLPESNEVTTDNGLPENNEVTTKSGLPENNEVTTKSGLPENNEVTTDNGLPESNEVTTDSGLPEDVEVTTVNGSPGTTNSGLSENNELTTNSGLSENNEVTTNSGLSESTQVTTNIELPVTTRSVLPVDNQVTVITGIEKEESETDESQINVEVTETSNVFLNDAVTVTGVTSKRSSKVNNGASRGYCSDILNIWLEEGCSNHTYDVNYERCLRPNNTFLDEIIPVTNLQTNTHYKNIYCALCNNDNNTVGWLHTGNCTNITDSHRNFNHCLSQMKNPTNEDIMICVPDTIDTYNKSTALQMGYSEEEIEDFAKKCDNFTSYVVDKNGNVYKNRYCYLLNNDDAECTSHVFHEKDIFCAQNRNELDNCMQDICSKNVERARYKYCSNETFRLSLSIVFDKGDTSELDILQDESELLYKGGIFINNGILDNLKYDINTTISCDVQDVVDSREVDKITIGSVLNCNIGDNVDQTIMVSDILTIILDGVKADDNNIKVPLGIQITSCTSRTSSFRQQSFICHVVSFDVQVTRVPFIAPLDLESYLSIICCALSDIGLIFRIVLQFTVPYFQTLPGKVQFCLCCMLFVSYSSFLIGGFVEIGSVQCYIAAVVTHWSMLSSLFWMNVIAFQIWRTFRVWHNQVSERRFRTLVVSSIYAIGIPTILVTTALFIELLYPKSAFSPTYGKYSCWMNKSYSVLTWFVIPSCTLSLINTLFALLTVRGLRVQRMMDEASSTNKVTPVNDFAVSVRIVILVGVTWILGLFAAFLGSPTTWLIFTLFNASLGFLISVVLLCNRRVFGLLKNKCLCPAKETFTSISVNNSSR